MSFTREDILRIAELARLELTEQEIEQFTQQLGGILDYVEQIRALSTDGVVPMTQVVQTPWERADAAREGLPRTQAIAHAPDAASEAGLFKVPRVME